MISLPNPVSKLLMTDFPSILITRTVEYSPDAYLEYCKENDLEPTREDFYSWIQEYVENDICNSYTHQTFEYIYD